MKQLGNLALVCAKRTDVELHIGSHQAFIYVGGEEVMSAPWDDDERIEEIIRELNFGSLSVKGGRSLWL